jgi:hypothetical protein
MFLWPKVYHDFVGKTNEACMPYVFLCGLFLVTDVEGQTKAMMYPRQRRSD